MRATAKSA